MLYAFITCPFCDYSCDYQVELNSDGELYEDQHVSCNECNAEIKLYLELEVNVVDTELVKDGIIFCKGCNFEQSECECEGE